MAKNQEDQNKNGKKKRHGVRNTVLGAAVLAVLAWLAAHFGGLGLGGGFGLGGTGEGQQVQATAGQTEAPQSNEASTAEDTTQMSSTEEPGTEQVLTEIAIRISEEEICVGTASYENADALKTYILSVYEDGIAISLKDDHAVKATYDEVKQMLETLGYPYTEVQ
jgi:hypothetical protein